MKLDDALDAAWEEWRTLTFEERVKRVDPHHERDLFLEFYHEMEARVVERGEFGGLFVGGTLRWKLDTGADWVALPNHPNLGVTR